MKSNIFNYNNLMESLNNIIYHIIVIEKSNMMLLYHYKKWIYFCLSKTILSYYYCIIVNVIGFDVLIVMTLLL